MRQPSIVTCGDPGDMVAFLGGMELALSCLAPAATDAAAPLPGTGRSPGMSGGCSISSRLFWRAPVAEAEEAGPCCCWSPVGDARLLWADGGGACWAWSRRWPDRPPFS